MRAAVEILAQLEAIEAELQYLLKTPLQVETEQQRLNRARQEWLAHHGQTTLERMHAMAVNDLYTGQASGRHLD